MIEQELLFLGLLKESPKHGYEIKKKVKELVSLFAGVDLKSVYYPLQVLEKNGQVVKRTIKSARHPARYVYELTPKGQSRFAQLLSKSLLNFKRPQFSLDLSLYFLHYMKPSVVRRRLQARIFILNKLSKSLGQMADSLKNKKSPSLSRILEHNLRMVQTESQFLFSLIKKL